MAKLLYTAITSLDGCVADEQGNFDWSVPDEEVHRFINDLEREIGTYLFGRKLYEVLVAWEDFPDLAAQPAYIQDYAKIWQAADKIVYSTTLKGVSSQRTRLERRFDPDDVRKMKGEAAQAISIGGPTLAAQALKAGLVDELQTFLNPAVVGGGTAWLPANLRLDLELVAERRFANGVVFLHYRVGNLT